MDSPTRMEPTTERGSGKVRAVLVAMLCVLYLPSLSGGWIEIPDCLPVIGNLDEVAVTVALARCLSTLGLSVLPGLGRWPTAPRFRGSRAGTACT